MAHRCPQHSRQHGELAKRWTETLASTAEDLLQCRTMSRPRLLDLNAAISSIKLPGRPGPGHRLSRRHSVPVTPTHIPEGCFASLAVVELEIHSGCRPLRRHTSASERLFLESPPPPPPKRALLPRRGRGRRERRERERRSGAPGFWLCAASLRPRSRRCTSGTAAHS